MEVHFNPLFYSFKYLTMNYMNRLKKNCHSHLPTSIMSVTARMKIKTIADNFLVLLFALNYGARIASPLYLKKKKVLK